MILNTFLIALAEVLHNIIYIYTIIIIIACVLSFVAPYSQNKFVQVIFRITEPAFNLVRKFIPTTFGGIDIAPVIVWVILMMLDKFAIRLIIELAS